MNIFYAFQLYQNTLRCESFFFGIFSCVFCHQKFVFGFRTNRILCTNQLSQEKKTPYKLHINFQNRGNKIGSQKNKLIFSTHMCTHIFNLTVKYFCFLVLVSKNLLYHGKLLCTKDAQSCDNILKKKSLYKMTSIMAYP